VAPSMIRTMPGISFSFFGLAENASSRRCCACESRSCGPWPGTSPTAHARLCGTRALRPEAASGGAVAELAEFLSGQLDANLAADHASHRIDGPAGVLESHWICCGVREPRHHIAVGVPHAQDFQVQAVVVDLFASIIAAEASFDPMSTTAACRCSDG
jgi:hypothetical protein